ncbi:unnamed protein product [Musa acuminata subsp. burmannicoides]
MPEKMESEEWLGQVTPPRRDGVIWSNTLLAEFDVVFLRMQTRKKSLVAKMCAMGRMRFERPNERRRDRERKKKKEEADVRQPFRCHRLRPAATTAKQRVEPKPARVGVILTAGAAVASNGSKKGDGDDDDDDDDDENMDHAAAAAALATVEVGS